MKDSKTIKVLRIITLTLSMLLLVFALAKKVGLCASGGSSSSVVTSLPCKVGAGWGNNWTANDIATIMAIVEQDRINTGDANYRQIGAVVISEYNSNDGTFRLRVYQTPSFTVTNPENFFTTGSTIDWAWGGSYQGCRELVFNSDLTLQMGWWRSSGAVMTVSSSNFLTSLPTNNKGIIQGQFYTGYPIYIIDDISYNNIVFFTDDDGSGVVVDDELGMSLEEWLEANINQVDTNAPSNSTSTPSWLQSILNGLGVINNTIGGGFTLLKNGFNTLWGVLSDFSTSVADGIRGLYDSVVAFGTDIFDTLDDIKDILSGNADDDNTLLTAWTSGYNNSVFYDIEALMSECKSIITTVFNAPVPASLSFSFSMPSIDVPNPNTGASNFVYLFGQTVSIDFSWYRSASIGGRSLYDIVNSTFFTFLYIGFITALFFKLPSIIGGASGFSHMMHGDYNSKIGNTSDASSNTKYDFDSMYKFLTS